MPDVSSAGNFCSDENQGFQFSRSKGNIEGRTQTDASTNVFLNHGETAWKESRKQWLGDNSCRRAHVAIDVPVISWSTTYEDLLWTGNVFDKAIPLSEMVDFLVDIWHDEGLYD